MNENVREIDFTSLVRALIHRWWLILAVGIIAAIAAFALSLLQSPEYRAEATVLFTRTRRELSLATQFPTLTDPVDTRARMDALLSIAESDDIAARTFDRVRNSYPDLIQKIGDIREMVEIVAKGDAIQITASAPNPDLAALVANTWAAESNQAINDAFIGNPPLEDSEQQLNLARQEYETAQLGLEDFLGSNQIDMLNSLIAESQYLLDRVTGERTSLVELYDERRILMERVLAEVEALQAQIEDGSDSESGNLGDSLAVLNARLGTLGISRTNQKLTTETTEKVTDSSLVGSDIIIQLADITALEDNASSLAGDLDSLIQIASEERDKADLALQELSGTIITGEESDQIEAAASHLAILRSRLEAENARSIELTSERDLKRSAYQALAQKNVELRTASDTGERVTLASEAIPPENPTTSGVILNTLLAGFLGVILAATGILIIEWWNASTKPSDSNETPAADR